jgi:plasmid stabilization system protein ParE
MKNIEVIELANLEYLDAIRFYNLENEKLALSFKNEILNIINIISKFPSIGEDLDKGIKKIVVHRFPFQIFYKEYDNKIVVFAISHQHREPYYWIETI